MILSWKIIIVLVTLILITIVVIIAVSLNATTRGVTTITTLGGDVQIFQMTLDNRIVTLSESAEAFLGTPILVRGDQNRVFYGVITLILPSDNRPIGALVYVKNMSSPPQNPTDQIGNSIKISPTPGITYNGAINVKANTTALLVKSNANEYTRLY